MWRFKCVEWKSGRVVRLKEVTSGQTRTLIMPQQSDLSYSFTVTSRSKLHPCGPLSWIKQTARFISECRGGYKTNDITVEEIRAMWSGGEQVLRRPRSHLIHLTVSISAGKNHQSSCLSLPSLSISALYLPPSLPSLSLSIYADTHTPAARWLNIVILAQQLFLPAIKVTPL